MKENLLCSVSFAFRGICCAIATIVFADTSLFGQTAYPEFYVGQATGSGLATSTSETLVQPSPSDVERGGLPAAGTREDDGAIVLADGLHSDGNWGFEEVGGAAACDCCPPRFYVIGEALAINREGDSGLRLSQSLQLGEFHYREGFRGTIGWTKDCLLGYEITVTRPLKWERGEFLNGTNLQSNLTAAPNFNPVDFAAFNNAVFHSQRYRSELYSVELNRRWWGWDVFSVKAGLRYMNVDEEFEFLSVDAFAASGEFRVETDNHMIGPQLGIDLTQPLGNWTFQSRIVGGAFVNINDESTLFRNGGSIWVNNSFNDEDFAWTIDVGLMAIYHFNDRLSARFGYEGWFVDGVVIAAEQQLTTIDLNMGLRSDARGDIFYHGASAGVELLW